MVKQNLNIEADDLQITPHLNMESEYGAYLKQLGDGFHATIVRSTKLLLNAADAYNQIGGKEQMGVSRRSTERWLQSWTETGILCKSEHGQYAKLSA